MDIETFYPWEQSYSQPTDKTPAQLERRRNREEAHPYAVDPRRCALRFLTISDGTEEPITFDYQAGPLPAKVFDALAGHTLVFHNADFDTSVLRRYGITLSSAIVDTMIAARLLGLGKEKPGFTVSEEIGDENSNPNPIDNTLTAVVRRYLGIKMTKGKTKLGGSDWGRSDLSPAHFDYMKEDVGYLPDLWEVLARELREADLLRPFEERMRFFPHLNQIKMTGIPINAGQLETDVKRVTEEKSAVREQLREMFGDCRLQIPKSRRQAKKIKAENGKLQLIPGPMEEEFSPSNRNHVLSVLHQRGILVENTQKATLQKTGTDECRLLLKYFTAKKRLEEINAIGRSTFPDLRVRAAGWDQLAAVTGRIISKNPNLQQVPRNWRTGFCAEPPKIWLKGDLEQIEMMLIAIVTDDRNLIDLLAGGRDVYVEYGARIFGRKPERGDGGDQITDDLRSVCKPIVLGTSYGLTPYGFVRQVENDLGIVFTLEEAEAFFESFFDMFPGIARYHERAAQEAMNLDSVRTIGGTRRWLPPLLDDQNGDYWPSHARRRKVLVNTPIQGSGADLVVWSVNRLIPELPPGTEVVNLVHDEINVLVTGETLLPTAKIITKAFQEIFAEFYPQTKLTPKIKFSSGPNWGELSIVT